MATREAISKKIRFEVFKRDKFTCQYCGGKAPDVVLNVDHINPVAKGGDNDILNLLTSCFSCNNGKRDKKLDDSSVIEKQRKQMELLEERREQLKLMVDWKKSLKTLDDDAVEMVADYINTKIAPQRSVSEQGKKSIGEWLKRHDFEKVLDAVDTSEKQYLKVIGDKLDEESIHTFFNKIGGILVVQGMPPIQKKLAYIKGIARNTFNYWDDRKGSIILSEYVKALQKHWTEEQILDDLEKEVQELTKNAKNWSEWKNILEKWTDDISKWESKEKETEVKSTKKEIYDDDELDSIVRANIYEQEFHIKALEHIASAFPDFSKEELRRILTTSLISFLRYHNEPEDTELTHEERSNYISEFIENNTTLLEEVFYYDVTEETDIGFFETLYGTGNELLIDVFRYSYYPRMNVDEESMDKMIRLHIKALSA